MPPASRMHIPPKDRRVLGQVAQSESAYACAEVHRILNHCGLEFEESCISFYDNTRAVRTPSSEQVRQPIYQGGVDQWQHFDEYLTPLKEALGSVLLDYA